MLRQSTFVVLGAALAAAAFPAASQEVAPAYYFSMRNLKNESSASFVSVVLVTDASHPTAVGSCNGATFYASAADAAVILAARTSGEIVQVHRVEEGETPQTAPIVCVIDGSGNT